MKLDANKKTGILVATLAILVAALIVAYLRPAALREPAPNVTLSLLDGSKPILADYKSKVVLISFWSVSCKICIAEFPHLNALHNKLKNTGLVIIGLNMFYDRPDWTVHFVKNQPILYPVSFDLRGKVSRAFGGIEVTPTTILIDKQGRIVWKKFGRLDFDKLEKRIVSLINET